MDDFEAFRKRKQQQKKAQAQAGKIDEQNKKLGWLEGLGPQGPTNPKVKGFVLGRYWSKKKVDPSTLQRPKGYESTELDSDAPAARAAREKLEEEVAKIREEAEAKIAALYAAAEEALAKELGDRRQLKGFQKF